VVQIYPQIFFTITHCPMGVDQTLLPNQTLPQNEKPPHLAGKYFNHIQSRRAVFSR